ncbi:MAG: DUF3606 domain-containing protein [Pseudolabrys sp.]
MGDLKNRQPQDPNRINIREEWEVRYWAMELKVSANELKRLVSETGSPNVRRAIRKKL